MSAQENVYCMFLPSYNNIASNFKDYVPRTYRGLSDSQEMSHWIVDYFPKGDYYYIFENGAQTPSRNYVCGESIAAFFNGYYLTKECNIQENVHCMFLPSDNNIASCFEDYVPRTYNGISDSQENSHWIVDYIPKGDYYFIYENDVLTPPMNFVCGEAVAAFFNGYYLALQNSS